MMKEDKNKNDTGVITKGGMYSKLKIKDKTLVIVIIVLSIILIGIMTFAVFG